MELLDGDEGMLPAPRILPEDLPHMPGQEGGQDDAGAAARSSRGSPGGASGPTSTRMSR